MKLRILVIGDPHFKPDNAPDTDLMAERILASARERKPHLIVVLGDTLHTFERLYQDPLTRAVKFLAALEEIASERLWLLIGNHDRPNNNVFLTDEHPFVALEHWKKTRVVSRPLMDTLTLSSESGACSIRLLCLPYVAPGRLDEALQTIGYSLDPKKEFQSISEASIVFAHQEFFGCRLGARTSEHGDRWPENAPPCFSGHIHEYDVLQGNLTYVGTPIQHGYSDDYNKAVLYLDLEVSGNRGTIVHQERVNLQLPRKIKITLTAEELAQYQPPENSTIRIVVEGDPTQIRQVLQLAHVKEMLQRPGITFKISDARASVIPSMPGTVQVNSSFSKRLSEAVSKEPSLVQQEFVRLFGPLSSSPARPMIRFQIAR